MYIVDNSPEMNLDDPKFSEMLAQIKPAGEKPTQPEQKTPEKTEKEEVVKKDVQPSASSADTTLDTSDNGEDDSPEKLKSQIRGLRAELSRRQGNADKVSELENQLAKAQGQLEQLNKSKTDTTIEDAVRQLPDAKALASKQTDWEDELADARARYASAEEREDETAMKKHGQRITYAKHVLTAIRNESIERSERKREQEEVEKTEASTIKSEFDSMYDALNEGFPDFQNKDSELWKAGDAEFRAHPKLMAKLGGAGEIVAAALAVLKNSHLINKKSESATRRDVVNTLEKGMKKALSTGASSPSTGRTTVPSVDSGQGLADFNRLVDSIKGG